MGDELQKVKLAAVQASSVFLDREATVEKASAIIAEAGAEGADIIGFPEGFIPAHPAWYGYQPAAGGKSGPLARELFQNAVEIPGPATEALSAACRAASINAVVGVCEKRPGTNGTMFNTQLFIGADGKILGKHQKLAPTVGERLVHTGGWGDTLTTFPTPFGNVSGLICGENSNPLAVYVMLAMNSVVHVASWPPHFGGGRSMQQTIDITENRRRRQMAYNQEHGIIPKTIVREISPSLAPVELEEDLEVAEEAGPFQSLAKLENELEELEEAMRRAAEALEFEEAAGYRDRIAQIKSKLEMVN